MKCPRCQGSLVKNYGEVKCISCGHITQEDDDLEYILNAMENSMETTRQAHIRRYVYPIVRDDEP